MNSKSAKKQLQQELFSLEDLDYELPEELIAQEPLDVRHKSRLLKVDRKNNSISHHQFEDIVDMLNPNDLVIVNDTKVIPTRLLAKRKTGGTIRIQLIKPKGTENHLWEAMAMPLKRVKAGEELEIVTANGKTKNARVEDLITDQDDYKRLVINFLTNKNMMEVLRESGHAPLPPYIKRELGPDHEDLNEKRLKDIARYQTVFAAAPGAVAAPTAGLHFSEEILEQLEKANIGFETITLHVGAGTFKPITKNIEEHSIEEEFYTISESVAERINNTKSSGGRVIAVGTTSLRALESAGSSGTVKAIDHQPTTLYVKPGFEFKVIDGLITNFHLSGSSLLVLVATYAGKSLILKAYNEAVRDKYRFYSYGDAMFIC